MGGERMGGEGKGAEGGRGGKGGFPKSPPLKRPGSATGKVRQSFKHKY